MSDPRDQDKNPIAEDRPASELPGAGKDADSVGLPDHDFLGLSPGEAKDETDPGIRSSRNRTSGGAMSDLPSTPNVGSAAIDAIELRPQGEGYVVTGIAGDGTVVSSGPRVADLPMAIAVARGIVRLAEFQWDGEVFRAAAL
jgi:hypothetical protein